MGRYNPADHARPLICQECGSENAPAEAESHDEQCHNCGYTFETPLSVGDDVTVEVSDIHESGRGLGRFDGGFIVLVSGVLPPSGDGVTEADVHITRVKSNYAEADKVHSTTTVNPDETTDADAEQDADEQKDGDGDGDGDDEDSDPSLGSRRDFWGSQ